MLYIWKNLTLNAMVEDDSSMLHRPYLPMTPVVDAKCLIWLDRWKTKDSTVLNVKGFNLHHQIGSDGGNEK